METPFTWQAAILNAENAQDLSSILKYNGLHGGRLYIAAIHPYVGVRGQERLDN
jgi:hypothetical protein